ncbi:hypothetical protein MHTCC0001_28950 [Flavobacteriaceae bacterium MHTCC 0001]
MKYLNILLLFTILTVYSCSKNEPSIEEDKSNPDTEVPDDGSGDNGDDNNNNNDGSDGDSNEGDDNNDNTTSTVDGIKIGPNYVVFEPEVTSSDLGLWVVRQKGEANYYPESDNFSASEGDIAAINDAYLEFTGNNLNGGQPKSPLTYTFTCPKTAKYRLTMRMLQPLEVCTPGSAHCTDGGFEKGDKRNDLWIKLDGDFTTACAYPTEELKKDHKFWGRGVRKWGSLHKLEGHVNGNRTLAKVVYNLKKDEKYTLTLSGRAQGCSIDYVLFYEESMGNAENHDFAIDNHTDLAAELPEFLRPDITD